MTNASEGSRVAGEALCFLVTDWLNKNFKYGRDYLHSHIDLKAIS